MIPGIRYVIVIHCSITTDVSYLGRFPQRHFRHYSTICHINSIHAIVVKLSLAALHCQPAMIFRSCDQPATYIRKFLRAELYSSFVTSQLDSYIRKFLRAELHSSLVTSQLDSYIR